jgi:hypothetical protein
MYSRLYVGKRLMCDSAQITTANIKRLHVPMEELEFVKYQARTAQIERMNSGV